MIFTKWKFEKTRTNRKNMQDCVRLTIRNGIFFIRFTSKKESDFDVILMIFMARLSWKTNDFHEMKIWKNMDDSKKHAGLCPFHHQKWHFFHFCHHFLIGKISSKWCKLHHFVPFLYSMGWLTVYYFNLRKNTSCFCENLPLLLLAFWSVVTMWLYKNSYIGFCKSNVVIMISYS